MRRSLILSAAYDSFCEKGYNTSLNDIAKGAGIRKQTLYNYFSNKDDLIMELIRVETTSYFELKRKEFRRLESFDAKTRLREMFMLIMAYYEDRQKLKFWKWLLHTESEDLKAKCKTIIENQEKRFALLLEATFQQGIAEGLIIDQPTLPLIHTYIALVHGTLDGFLFYDDILDREIYINNIWGTFWRGIEKTT